MLCRQMYTVLCYLTQFLLMLPNMFLAYRRLIFRGSFVEITTAILLVYKILRKPLDVFSYWYLYRSCCFHYRLVGGLRVGRNWVRLPQVARSLSFLQSAQTSSMDHPVSSSISAAIPLPLYAFIAFKGTILSFIYYLVLGCL
jgi:hypothetical protein